MQIPSWNSFGSVSCRDLAFAEPRFEVQVALAGLHTVAWFVMIKSIIPPIARRIISGMESKDHFLELFRQSMKQALLYDMGPDREKQLRETADFMGILVQHGIGGALCIPSVLGLASRFPSGIVSAMARHGGLCEVGWEISDTLSRIYQIFCGGQEGRAKNPPSLLVMFLMHHSCAQAMVLPLNIYYPENVYYHEGIFLLQFAAFAALMVQMYGYTLDVATPNGLKQMKRVTGFSLGVMTWARVLRYGYVWSKLMSTFQNDGNTFVLRLAQPSVVLLSLFNVALMGDCIQKFFKFWNKTIERESLEDIQEHPTHDLVLERRLPFLKSSCRSTTSQEDSAKVHGAVLLGAVTTKKVQ